MPGLFRGRFVGLLVSRPQSKACFYLQDKERCGSQRGVGACPRNIKRILRHQNVFVLSSVGACRSSCIFRHASGDTPPLKEGTWYPERLHKNALQQFYDDSYYVLILALVLSLVFLLLVFSVLVTISMTVVGVSRATIQTASLGDRANDWQVGKSL